MKYTLHHSPDRTIVYQIPKPQKKWLSIGGAALALVVCLSACRAFEPRFTAAELPHYKADTVQHDYVDFHNHLTLKPYYQLIASPQAIVNLPLVLNPIPHYTSVPPAVWDPDGKLSHAAWQFNTPQERAYQAYGSFADLKRYRQSAWPELNGYKVVCTSLYSFEKGLTTNEKSSTFLISNQALKRLGIQTITGLNKQRRQVVYDLTLEPFAEIQAEYEFLKHQVPSVAPGSAQRVVLAEPRTLDSLLQAPNTTIVVISIEGGHVLLGPDVLRKSENRLLLDVTTQQDVHDIRNRIAVLKSWQHPVFFLTLTHLIWNKLAGQAKGTDGDGWKRGVLSVLSSQESFRSATFTQPNSGIAGISPASYDEGNTSVCYDNGFTSRLHPDKYRLGLVAIQELLNTQDGQRRILVDLRHASIKTRLEFYHLRDSLYQDVPPIVSHCAASGESLRLAIATGLRWPSDRFPEFNNPDVFYKKLAGYKWRMFNLPPYNEYFADHDLKLRADELYRMNVTGWFHPTSNNLADEEIEYITRKDGIMGLTVEQRALGGSMKQYAKTKQASRQRLRDWLTRNKSALSSKQREELEKHFFAAAPFIRNLWYFTSFTKEGVDVWQHLTIGSDYDGIADPLDSFATSGRIAELESFINDYHLAFEYVYGLHFNLAKRTMAQNLRLVFSNNGLTFIRKYYPRY